MPETEITIIPKGLHAPEHQTGGIDVISVAGLAGLLLADQHVIDAEVLAVAEAIGVAAGLITTHAGLPNVHHTPIPPTREFFVLPSTLSTEIAFDAGNKHVGAMLNAAGEKAIFEFHIPDDFTAITEVVAVLIPQATATMRFDLDTIGGAIGATKDSYQDDAFDVEVVCTINVLAELDLSTGFGFFEGTAGYTISHTIIADAATNIPNCLVCYLRFKYS